MRRLAAVCLSVALVPAIFADMLDENFDDPNLPGWVIINNSEEVGPEAWFPGNDGVFPPHEGDGYAAANFNSAKDGAGVDNISTWLLSPMLALNNGDTFTFYTRTVQEVLFADRLEVRISEAGDSTDVGGTAESVGDFDILLETINPNLTLVDYPTAWTMISVEVSGLAARADGRIAFRYYVTDGGPGGNNSDYIGVDTFSYVPEPGSLGLLAIGLMGLLRRR